MKYYEATSQIHARPEQVWSVLIDPGSWPDWDSGVEGVEGVEGDIGLGRTESPSVPPRLPAARSPSP